MIIVLHFVTLDLKLMGKDEGEVACLMHILFLLWVRTKQPFQVLIFSSEFCDIFAAHRAGRWIGLMGLTGELSPVRHPAKRRRMRTVMQELMYLAARVVESGHRLKFKFSSYCPGFEVYRLVYQQLAYG